METIWPMPGAGYNTIVFLHFFVGFGWVGETLLVNLVLMLFYIQVGEG